MFDDPQFPVTNFSFYEDAWMQETDVQGIALIEVRDFCDDLWMQETDVWEIALMEVRDSPDDPWMQKTDVAIVH